MSFNKQLNKLLPNWTNEGLLTEEAAQILKECYQVNSFKNI